VVCQWHSSGARRRPAAKALESEERGYLDQRRLEATTRRIYFPSIVTTAQLSVCSFVPKSISLVDGTIPSSAEFAPAGAIRLHKQLSTEPAPGPFGPHGQEAVSLASAKERTVFIVNAENFDTFLCRFRVDDRYG
jgi:hypothetical protein